MAESPLDALRSLRKAVELNTSVQLQVLQQQRQETRQVPASGGSQGAESAPASRPSRAAQPEPDYEPAPSPRRRGPRLEDVISGGRERELYTTPDSPFIFRRMPRPESEGLPLRQARLSRLPSAPSFTGGLRRSVRALPGVFGEAVNLADRADSFFAGLGEMWSAGRAWRNERAGLRAAPAMMARGRTALPGVPRPSAQTGPAPLVTRPSFAVPPAPITRTPIIDRPGFEAAQAAAAPMQARARVPLVSTPRMPARRAVRLESLPLPRPTLPRSVEEVPSVPTPRLVTSAPRPGEPLRLPRPSVPTATLSRVPRPEPPTAALPASSLPTLPAVAPARPTAPVPSASALPSALRPPALPIPTAPRSEPPPLRAPRPTPPPAMPRTPPRTPGRLRTALRPASLDNPESFEMYADASGASRTRPLQSRTMVMPGRAYTAGLSGAGTSSLGTESVPKEQTEAAQKMLDAATKLLEAAEKLTKAASGDETENVENDQPREKFLPAATGGASEGAHSPLTPVQPPAGKGAEHDEMMDLIRGGNDLEDLARLFL